MDHIDQLYQEPNILNNQSESSQFSIQKLYLIVNNEKYAPELLAFQPLVLKFLNRVNERDSEINQEDENQLLQQESTQENVSSYDGSLGTSGGDGQNFSLQESFGTYGTQELKETSIQQLKAYKMIKLLELDKIRYIIAEYFRIRRKKIELFSHYLIQQVEQGENDLLSELELNFAQKLSKLEIELYRQGFQESMDASYWESEEFHKLLQERKPNFKQFVFGRVREEVGSTTITLDGDNIVTVQAGSIYAFIYETIRDSLKQNNIELI